MSNLFEGSRANSCPWAFAMASDSAPLPRNSKPPSMKARTFASIVSDSTERVSLSQLPIPVIRGDQIFVKISKDLYQQQLQSFRTNLIGRLLLRKGTTPLKTAELKSSLEALWRPVTPWLLVPLGKGYFDIHFNTEDDKRRIWGGGNCTLPNGIFRLSEWQQDFNPNDIAPPTHAQVWIRIYGLSQDYWHPRHLLEIARGVGTPLQLDKATKERQFGYYARALVDVDLAVDLPSSIMVEREGHSFPIDIVYEKLPDKCNHCGILGHTIDRCRHLKKKNVAMDSQPSLAAGRKVNNRTEYRVIQDPKRNECVDLIVVDKMQPIEEVVHSSSPMELNSPLVQQPDNQLAGLANEIIESAANEIINLVADLVVNEPMEVTKPTIGALISKPTRKALQEEQGKNVIGDDSESDEAITPHSQRFEVNYGDLGTNVGQLVCQHSSPNSSDLQEGAKICDIVNEDGMTLVLSKSQKAKMRKKIRDGNISKEVREPYPTRSRVPTERLDL
ncbi:hypothetical protein COP2_022299 [Malus domestica]